MLEKKCSKCHDYWPADREFFYASKNKKDGLRNECKACYSEYKSVSRRNKRGGL